MWSLLVSEYICGFFELVFFSFPKHPPSHSLAHGDKFKVFPIVIELSVLWEGIS